MHAPTEAANSTALQIAHVRPDVLVLSGLDYDHGLSALKALRDLVANHGHDFEHLFALPSNAGLRHLTPGDIPRALTGPDDAQGYGAFAGAGALAMLSRYPVDLTRLRDFSDFLWRDLPDSLISDHDRERYDTQRLSSTGHWDVPVMLGPGQRLHLLIYQAGPPVFGDAHHTNRLRNHDETAFWTAYLDARLAVPPPAGPLVVIGGSNLDPRDGDGLHQAMQALLTHPRLQDPQPSSDGARHAARTDKDRAHLGPPELDTVHWPQDRGPGNLRVSYILPSVGLGVTGSGVFWPHPDTPEAAYLGPADSPPTRHRMVWVDIDRASLTVEKLN
ncbi:MAG: endonuclease/exonuclease/phosphatase family protein [Rhodobacteraceae bacterium]|nr:MAG: endonuclease/exonuclease/phosphatase family protein [Paracoccaceae bacterium]